MYCVNCSNFTTIMNEMIIIDPRFKILNKSPQEYYIIYIYNIRLAHYNHFYDKRICSRCYYIRIWAIRGIKGCVSQLVTHGWQNVVG